MAMSQTIDEMDHTLVTPAEIQWRPAPAVLPAGAQSAVLYGDPNKEGLFSMWFRLPKGYRVPPHTLSKPGLFTVISGTFRIGMGEKADPSKAKAMPAGSFIALAPGTPHFVAVDEETVVQLNNLLVAIITVHLPNFWPGKIVRSRRPAHSGRLSPIGLLVPKPFGSC